MKCRNLLLLKGFHGLFYQLKKWANPGLFFVYYCSFLITISIQIEKSIDGVLGIRTRGLRMVGADYGGHPMVILLVTFRSYRLLFSSVLSLCHLLTEKVVASLRIKPRKTLTRERDSYPEIKVRICPKVSCCFYENTKQKRQGK